MSSVRVHVRVVPHLHDPGRGFEREARIGPVIGRHVVARRDRSGRAPAKIPEMERRLEEPGEDPNELAYDYVNQAVTVTGAVYERGGLRGIVAESVEPLAGPAATPDTDTPTPATPPIESDDLD